MATGLWHLGKFTQACTVTMVGIGRSCGTTAQAGNLHWRSDRAARDPTTFDKFNITLMPYRLHGLWLDVGDPYFSLEWSQFSTSMMVVQSCLDGLHAPTSSPQHQNSKRSELHGKHGPGILLRHRTLPGSSRNRAAKRSPSWARNHFRSSSPRQCASRNTK